MTHFRKRPVKTSPPLPRTVTPALLRNPAREAGKVRPMILLWALGVPIPIILVIALVRGCG